MVQRKMYYWPVTVTAPLDLDLLERVGTALADRTRRLILLRLLDGPAYPADLALALGTSRAGISNHLACLRGCGLVNPTREGRRIRYELTDPRLASALRQLTQVVLTSDACPAHLRQPA
jgi:ArsR family transcriptional regulator, cadmium/lead-responsive transcriptional repressor